MPDNTTTGVDADLATLLASGDVTSALLLKGDFTDQERELIRQAYEAGVAHGSGRVEAELSRLGALYSCGYATGQGQNCGKCQQCLLVHEHFLKEACEQHKAELSRLREQRDAAQQDRNEYIDIAEREGARCARLEGWEKIAATRLRDINALSARCARLEKTLREARRRIEVYETSANDGSAGISAEETIAAVTEALAGTDTP